jgi:hypothetical protein
MPPRKSAARGDKVKSSTREEVAQTQATPSSVQAPAEERQEADPAEEWGYLYYTFRQHIGFVLGALSIFLTWYTWEEHNPNSVWRALACLCLCLVGMGFHELRPFQRKGYGDIARDRAMQNPTSANVRAAMAG